MAAEGIMVENARQEKDNVWQSSQGTASAESPQPPSSFETPRASSVSTPKSSVPSSVRSTPKQSVSKSGGLSSSAKSTPAREKPAKYVSKMAKAREERKRREAASTNSDKTSTTSSDMETLSNPSTESGTISVKSQAPADKLGNLPKFGEWNKHSANSGPCYTLLFQNAAQEKKIGGPIRVHAPSSKESQLRNEDLYRHDRAATVKITPEKASYSLLCCFTAPKASS